MEEADQNPKPGSSKDIKDAEGTEDASSSPLENMVQNPFLIAEVMSNVIRQTSGIQELKNLQLLHSLWRKEGLKTWRETAVLRVYIKECKCCPIPSKALGLQELTELAQDPAYQLLDKPFQRYKIIINSCNQVKSIPPFPEEKPQCQKKGKNRKMKGGTNDTDFDPESFWKTYGPFMKYLCLKTPLEGDRLTQALTFLLRKYCINLEELIVSFPDFYYLKNEKFRHGLAGKGTDDAEFQVLESKLKSFSVIDVNLRNKREGWRPFRPSADDERTRSNYAKILCIMPHLKSLKVDGLGYPLIDLLKHPNPITKKFIKLDCFDIELFHEKYYKSKENFMHICDMARYVRMAESPLTKIKIGFNWYNNGSEIHPVTRLVKNCQSTLKTLDLTMNCVETHAAKPDMNITWFNVLSGFELEELTFLNLNFRNYNDGNQLVLFDFNDFEGMPALKKLHYFGWFGDVDDFPKKSKKKQKSITTSASDGGASALVLEDLAELRFDTKEKIGADVLRKLKTFFPNLKVLMTVLNEKTFPLVFDLWPELVKVVLLKKSNVMKGSVLRESARFNVKIETEEEGRASATSKNDSDSESDSDSGSSVGGDDSDAFYKPEEFPGSDGEDEIYTSGDSDEDDEDWEDASTATDEEDDENENSDDEMPKLLEFNGQENVLQHMMMMMLQGNNDSDDDIDEDMWIPDV